MSNSRRLALSRVRYVVSVAVTKAPSPVLAVVPMVGYCDIVSILLGMHMKNMTWLASIEPCRDRVKVADCYLGLAFGA